MFEALKLGPMLNIMNDNFVFCFAEGIETVATSGGVTMILRLPVLTPRGVLLAATLLLLMSVAMAAPLGTTTSSDEQEVVLGEYLNPPLAELLGSLVPRPSVCGAPFKSHSESLFS